MRFRKSIPIAKGVRLNLSKSGASLTVGKKGLSVNVGGNGAFVNWSIPGTGVYDRVRVDTLVKDMLGLGGDDAGSRSAGKTARKKAQGASREALEQLAQEEAFFTLCRKAPDVSGRADAAPMDEERAQRAIEDWLNGSQSPVPFAVQMQADAQGRAVLLDLDLPEIEDMPKGKAVRLADGTVKIKDKTQKQQREDYRACVFGLAVYVAAHVLSLVPQCKHAAVSAYTRRRDAKTGDARDVFIYSIIFERTDFVSGYQRMPPESFCSALRGRFYVPAGGLMKEIVPYDIQDI